jgi:uncharacterized protein DUF6428
MATGSGDRKFAAAQAEENPTKSESMKTNGFISALHVAPQNRLIFVDVSGHVVPSGYHLTELKSASFDTVDCGGQVNRWQETIVQLWVPPDPAEDYMTTAKFLKIFDKVGGMIPLNFDAEVRIEYGDENLFPSIYHVRSVSRDEHATRVLLEPPAPTCKARDRRRALQLTMAGDTCCAATKSCCSAK